jgi:uncharacterized membrane protein YfcA
LSAADYVLLVLAGIGAGLAGSIIGLASLVSYPALLALGFAPLSANVTNTVALVFSSVGSVTGSVPELAGQAPRARRLAGAGILGGATGAGLLLITPSDDFERIVPWLIALAAFGVLVRRPTPRIEQHRDDPRWLPAAVFVVAIYGGYFGAAAGVVILSLLLLATEESLPRATGMKNVVLGLANAVAAVMFAVVSPVHWLAVLPMAIGCYAGGRLGPLVVRRAPPAGLRIVIFAVAMGLAIHLGLDAYR